MNRVNEFVDISSQSVIHEVSVWDSNKIQEKYVIEWINLRLLRRILLTAQANTLSFRKLQDSMFSGWTLHSFGQVHRIVKYTAELPEIFQTNHWDSQVRV